MQQSHVSQYFSAVTQEFKNMLAKMDAAGNNFSEHLERASNQLRLDSSEVANKYKTFADELISANNELVQVSKDLNQQREGLAYVSNIVSSSATDMKDAVQNAMHNIDHAVKELNESVKAGNNDLFSAVQALTNSNGSLIQIHTLLQESIKGLNRIINESGRPVAVVNSVPIQNEIEQFTNSVRMLHEVVAGMQKEQRRPQSTYSPSPMADHNEPSVNPNQNQSSKIILTQPNNRASQQKPSFVERVKALIGIRK